ncbi:hypothetical protein SAMN05421820_103381 [Pedobacter steynii]|uniref:Uncharacterized protein n=1 Tax=Pedobacter steynii TaxID=430522 RepID=A0A1G9RY60_9SPHI|nr:hypothetical protein [Pedobacter steynii]NQX37624.1 hypothetical protein [Pedobacter steynii]SDM27435.1 hypothetical protein SAMN05421820_103381 [Pedobacter steynii]
MSRSWYAYMGLGDPLLCSGYVKVTVKHNCICGEKICAIYAAGEGFRPTEPFSENMQQYIKKALATGRIQPERPFGSKKYVYLR